MATDDLPAGVFARHRLRRRSLIAGGAALGLVPAARPAAAAVVNFCVIGTDGWLFIAFDEVRQSDPAAIQRTTQTINEAVAALRAAKVDVAISLTPSKSRVYREYLPADLKWSPEAEKRYANSVAALRAPGTLVPDQATLFAEARKRRPADVLFFKADTHWTGPGAEMAATFVANAVKEKIRLPASAKPGVKLAPASSITQERNDLSALLPQPDQSKYPFQSYPLRKPAVSGGGDLLDDDTADVVVMGNSYMQPAYGFSDVVSEQLNRPVSLVWKVHQFSPYWNMLNYVRSDGFKKQRPKLIIWDFAETDMETAASNTGAWGQTAMSPAAFVSDLRKALGV